MNQNIYQVRKITDERLIHGKKKYYQTNNVTSKSQPDGEIQITTDILDRVYGYLIGLKVIQERKRIFNWDKRAAIADEIKRVELFIKMYSNK